MSIAYNVYKKLSSSAVRVCLLSFLLLMVVLAPASAMAKKKKKKNTGKEPVEYALTVAEVRPAQPGDQYTEVTFLESARFYRLHRNADPAFLELLKKSQEQHTQVLVKRANEYSDIITRVRKK
jgi:hypothetical protein